MDTSVTSKAAVVYNLEKSAVDQYAKAKALELGNWNRHDAFEEVPDGKKVPDYGKKVPDYGKKVPDYGKKVPDYGKKVPDYG